MFYKKKLFVVALTFMVFLMALFANAQTVIVVLKQPPPNQWHVEDMWQLTLTNTLQESCNVYLYGTVEEADAGLIFEGTSASFTLEPNYSGPVYRSDLEPADVEFTNDDYEDIVQRTGTLPAGTYTICIYVKSVDGEDMGYDCKIQIIAHPSPPELINPVDEANVTEELPVFLWLPPMPIDEFVTYNIKLVELLDNQIPIEAMEANPAFYIEEDIPATSFQFPISARPFESGINYAWKVTAISGDGLVMVESPVWSFNYEAAVVVIYEPMPNELISPVNGQVYDGPASQPLIMFKWMPIDITAVNATLTTNPISISEVFYNLMIWKLPDYLAKKVEEGNILIEEDLSDLEPYFVKEEIKGTSCIYPYEFDLVELMSGYHYAWQIQTFCGVGQPIGNNHGKSEVSTFSVNLEQLVSSLDCDSIRKILDDLKAQLKAKTKNCLDKADRLNRLKDDLSRNKNMLNNAKENKKTLEEKLNKHETSFRNAFNYLKQILGNEATLIEYSNSEDLKQKAVGQNYIGSGGIAILFNDAQSILDAFDRYSAVTGENVGACLKKLRKLRSQKENTKNALQNTENNIQKLNSKIKKLQNNISSLSNELKACRDEIKNLNDKIANLIAAYEECQLAFNAAMQEAENLIEHVDEMINDPSINLSLDSLDTDLRKLQSVIDDCCGTGCECSEMRSSLTQAQEHHQNANEFMKQAKAKLKQAKEKVNTDPREANRLAGEASELVRKAKNELEKAKNSIKGLADNKCTPGTIKDKKKYKRFKITKIVDVGLVPHGKSIADFKKRMKDYEKSASWISWVYKLSSVLENLGNLINSAFEFVLAGFVDIAQPADKSEIVDAVLEAWPKIIEANEAMQMYYIVEGYYETKETWEECDECCKWVNKEGPVSNGPTVQKTIRAKWKIIKRAGEIDMRVKTNMSADNLTTQLKNLTVWQCE